MEKYLHTHTHKQILISVYNSFNTLRTALCQNGDFCVFLHAFMIFIFLYKYIQVIRGSAVKGRDLEQRGFWVSV